MWNLEAKKTLSQCFKESYSYKLNGVAHKELRISLRF